MPKKWSSSEYEGSECVEVLRHQQKKDVMEYLHYKQKKF